MATNPVLNKFKVPGTASGPGTARANPTAAPSAGDLEHMYNQPAYGGPIYPPTGFGPGGGGGGGGGACDTGFSPGAGGNGGRGEVRVTWTFS